MDIAVIGIIVLRLTVPLLIVRFPLIGLLAAATFDIIDYSIIGGNPWYQAVDKSLDLLYLAACLTVALTSWRSLPARRLALGLFGLRAAGVAGLAAGLPEWSLVYFPNIFETVFVFYTIYLRLAPRPDLFSRRSDIPLLLIAVSIPKFIQEYALHAAPYANETPAVITFLSQGATGIISWLILPTFALVYFVNRARASKQAPYAQTSDLRLE